MANVLPKAIADLFGDNALTGNVGDDTLPICVKNGKLATADNSSYVEYSFEGSNGYIKYRNGLIIQWGYDRATYDGNYSVFPISFATTDYRLVLQRDVGSSSTLAIFGVLPSSVSQFHVVTDMQSMNPAFRYIAIGY